jgi:long-chain-acyl-CoA dehydrogenase
MERTVYSSEHRQFGESIAGFVADDLLPQLPRYRADGAVDRAAFARAGALGLLGLAIPSRFGGSQADDYRFHTVAIEQLAAATHGLSSTFTIHFDIATPYIVDLAVPSLAERVLPRLATGDAIAAIAMTEAGGGSDLAALTTRARRVDDGWVIDGSKTFITNGGIADVVVVAARTSDRGARGISLFVVEAPTAGFTPGPTLDKLGLHESNTAELFLDGVHVAEDALLGQVDGGFTHLMQRLPQERLSSAVANLAQARTVLGQALDHARTRSAFGTPIGSMQHNKFAFADLSARIEALSTFVDACIGAHVAGRLTTSDAARAKLLSAEVEHDVLDAAIQLSGGAGLMADNPIGQAWVDGRATRIWAGTSEVMREIIGRDLGL